MSLQWPKQWQVRRWMRRSRLFILSFLVLALLVFPHPAQSQPFQPDSFGRASVVVDGIPIFEVGDVGALSATQRARQINTELEQEVRSPELADIQVERRGNLIYLQSRHTNEILTTITETDVVPPQDTPYEQAVIWANELETALRRGQLERQPAYLRQAALYSALVILGAIAIHLLLQVGGRLLLQRVEQRLRRTSPFTEWERSLRMLWHFGVLGIQIGLWGTVAYYITDIFPQLRSWRYKLANFLNARIIDLGDRNYSALELLLFLGLTLALWFAVSLMTRLFRIYVLSRAGIETRIQDILSVLVQYSLAFLGVIVLLQIWGIDLSSLAILASVLGVGLGFGVQNITNNFISGFVITLERPIQVGDFVNVGELVGTVERIGARSTEIRTLDQVTIIVPNSRFLENEVINWSHGDPVSRIHIPVNVAYGSDIERVKKALLEAVRRHPEVLLQPRPEVWFQGYGESALKFELLVWTGEPRKQFQVKSDLYYEVETSLRRYDLSVPFPQRDLHLRSPHLDDVLGLLKDRLSQGGSPAQDAHSPFQLTPPPDPALLRGSLVDDADIQELKALIERMQGDAGVEVGDRHYRFNYYPACFTGAEVVGWLVQHQGYTREEAIKVGQALLQLKLIHPVSDDPMFRDGYHFYRFDRDERSLSERQQRQR